MEPTWCHTRYPLYKQPIPHPSLSSPCLRGGGQTFTKFRGPAKSESAKNFVGPPSYIPPSFSLPSFLPLQLLCNPALILSLVVPANKVRVDSTSKAYERFMREFAIRKLSFQTRNLQPRSDHGVPEPWLCWRLNYEKMPIQ